MGLFILAFQSSDERLVWLLAVDVMLGGKLPMLLCTCCLLHGVLLVSA